MRVKTRELLELCIERGLERGWHRAHKHTETPTLDGMVTAQQDAIWLELDTFFEFGGYNEKLLG